MLTCGEEDETGASSEYFWRGEEYGITFLIHWQTKLDSRSSDMVPRNHHKHLLVELNIISREQAASAVVFAMPPIFVGELLQR